MENDVKEDLEQARPKLELEKQKQELEKLTQEKEQEIKKNKEGRKYIYIIIIFLFMLYPILSSITYDEPSQVIKTAHTKTILEILPDPISDLIKNNLDSHQQEISDLLSSSKDKMYSKVDAQIDNLFDPIENNVDKFLDWHYSLKGNYSELALFVAKKLGLSVEDALFKMKKNLKESYKISFDNSITKFSQEFQKDLKNIETISVKVYVEKLK